MSHVEEWRAEVLQILRRNDRQLDIIHHEIHHILEKVTKMQTEWDNLISEISGLTSVTEGVKAVVDKLLEIISTGPTLEAVRTAAAEIKRNREGLAAAVEKGTPADPNAPPA